MPNDSQSIRAASQPAPQPRSSSSQTRSTAPSLHPGKRFYPSSDPRQNSTKDRLSSAEQPLFVAKLRLTVKEHSAETHELQASTAQGAQRFAIKWRCLPNTRSDSVSCTQLHPKLALPAEQQPFYRSNNLRQNSTNDRLNIANPQLCGKSLRLSIKRVPKGLTAREASRTLWNTVHTFFIFLSTSWS